MAADALVTMLMAFQEEFQLHAAHMRGQYNSWNIWYDLWKWIPRAYCSEDNNGVTFLRFLRFLDLFGNKITGTQSGKLEPI